MSYDVLAWNEGVAYRFVVEEELTRVYVEKRPVRFEMRLEGSGPLDRRIASAWCALEGRMIAGADMVDEGAVSRVADVVAALKP